MADFNQAVILGNLTRDPELRSTSTGQSVASFTIATNRRWTTKDGQQQEETEFHNIVAWGKLAEIVGQILYKGRKVLVAGRLRTRQWEGQDGVKRYSTEIVADHVSATGPSRATEQGLAATDKTEQTPNSTEQEAKTAPAGNVAEEINLDDIPF